MRRLNHLLGLLLGPMAFGVAGPAQAHDVQNSEVRVVFGEDNRKGSVEVWQTMSLETAYEAARTSSNQTDADADLEDSDVLEIFGPQLLIQTATGSCAIEKQAHRRVHHGTRLQMRFLFACAEDKRPTKMTLAWMSHTPAGHFAVLEQDSGQGSPFKVIEKGRPVIDFHSF